jgi:hypothetical protein
MTGIGLGKGSDFLRNLIAGKKVGSFLFGDISQVESKLIGKVLIVDDEFRLAYRGGGEFGKERSGQGCVGGFQTYFESRHVIHWISYPGKNSRQSARIAG